MVGRGISTNKKAIGDKLRTAAKIDANQVEIVKALREAGATVQSLAAIGKGCPDILVGVNGCTLLMEIKDGSKAPSARKLTDDQLTWHSKWTGGTLCVVDGIEAALRMINVAKQRKAKQ